MWEIRRYVTVIRPFLLHSSSAGIKASFCSAVVGRTRPRSHYGCGFFVIDGLRRCRRRPKGEIGCCPKRGFFNILVPLKKGEGREGTD